MIWIILAALGVPIWLIAGMLAGVVWSRRRFKNRTGTFPCRVRTLTPGGPAPAWPRTKAYAFWVRDVLLVHTGVALVRYSPYPVRDVVETGDDAALRFGDAAAATVVLRLDDGAMLEVAAPDDQRHLLEARKTASDGARRTGGRDGDTQRPRSLASGRTDAPVPLSDSGN